MPITGSVQNIMYNQLLISLQIEEKWYTFRLFFGILSCYYLHYHKYQMHSFLYQSYLSRRIPKL